MFEIHREKVIGYKRLTDADLRQTEGHTTHIGLFMNVLTFLPDKDYYENGIFIYDDSCQILPVAFDRINRQSGEMNAPKIRTGGRGAISVVSTIHRIVREENNSLRWYLFWFGLSDGRTVFLLSNDDSENYRQIIDWLDLDDEVYVKGIVNREDHIFETLSEYLINQIEL